MKRLIAIMSLSLGLSALALAAMGLLLVPGAPAHAQSFTVQSGQTVGPQVMGNPGDTGTIEPGGTVISGAGTAIDMSFDNQTLNNGGLVTTTGAGNVAIESGGANDRISNSGAITTTGTGADGIASIGANVLITNSGDISVAAGGGTSAIRADGVNAQVINSGRLFAPLSNAIEFNGAQNNTLTLLPGSVIQGALLLGGGTDTLNVGNGLSISSTFSKAPEMLNANGAPFAVSGTQVAVVDPTTLSTQDEALADLTGGIFSTVQNRLTGLRNGVAGVTTNPRPMYVAGEEGGGIERARQYWAQAFGSYRDQQGDGPAVDTDQRVAGFVSGLDAQRSAHTRVGFFLGGSWGEAENTLETQQTDTDSFFGGAYLSTLQGRTAIDLMVTAGWSDYERERQVANNLVAGGLQTAQADYDGFFVSPEITFTRPFWPMGTRVEKVVTLRYAGLFLDGFTETGAADAFSVESRDIHLGVARAALALPMERQSEDGGTSRLTLTSGIEGRAQFGEENVSGTLLAQNIVFDPGGDDSTIAGFAGIKGEHTTPGGLTAFISLEGKVEDEDTHQVSARGGIRVRF